MPKSSKKVKISILRCPECGEVMFVPRRRGKWRKVGHIKTMWCPYCERMVDFVEEG